MLLDKMEVVLRSDTPECVASGGRVFRDTAVVAQTLIPIHHTHTPYHSYSYTLRIPMHTA